MSEEDDKQTSSTLGVRMTRMLGLRRVVDDHVDAGAQLDQLLSIQPEYFASLLLDLPLAHAQFLLSEYAAAPSNSKARVLAATLRFVRSCSSEPQLALLQALKLLPSILGMYPFEQAAAGARAKVLDSITSVLVAMSRHFEYSAPSFVDWDQTTGFRRRHRTAPVDRDDKAHAPDHLLSSMAYLRETSEATAARIGLALCYDIVREHDLALSLLEHAVDSLLEQPTTSARSSETSSSPGSTVSDSDQSGRPEQHLRSFKCLFLPVYSPGHSPDKRPSDVDDNATTVFARALASITPQLAAKLLIDVPNKLTQQKKISEAAVQDVLSSLLCALPEGDDQTSSAFGNRTFLIHLCNVLDDLGQHDDKHGPENALSCHDSSSRHLDKQTLVLSFLLDMCHRLLAAFVTATQLEEDENRVAVSKLQRERSMRGLAPDLPGTALSRSTPAIVTRSEAYAHVVSVAQDCLRFRALSVRRAAARLLNSVCREANKSVLSRVLARQITTWISAPDLQTRIDGIVAAALLLVPDLPTCSTCLSLLQLEKTSLQRQLAMVALLMSLQEAETCSSVQALHTALTKAIAKATAEETCDFMTRYGLSAELPSFMELSMSFCQNPSRNAQFVEGQNLLAATLELLRLTRCMTHHTVRVALESLDHDLGEEVQREALSYLVLVHTCHQKSDSVPATRALQMFIKRSCDPSHDPEDGQQHITQLNALCQALILSAKQLSTSTLLDELIDVFEHENATHAHAVAVRTLCVLLDPASDLASPIRDAALRRLETRLHEILFLQGGGQSALAFVAAFAPLLQFGPQSPVATCLALILDRVAKGNQANQSSRMSVIESLSCLDIASPSIMQPLMSLSYSSNPRVAASARSLLFDATRRLLSTKAGSATDQKRCTSQVLMRLQDMAVTSSKHGNVDGDELLSALRLLEYTYEHAVEGPDSFDMRRSVNNILLLLLDTKASVPVVARAMQLAFALAEDVPQVTKVLRTCFSKEMSTIDACAITVAHRMTNELAVLVTEPCELLSSTCALLSSNDGQDELVPGRFERHFHACQTDPQQKVSPEMSSSSMVSLEVSALLPALLVALQTVPARSVVLECKRHIAALRNKHPTAAYLLACRVHGSELASQALNEAGMNWMEQLLFGMESVTSSSGSISMFRLAAPKDEGSHPRPDAPTDEPEESPPSPSGMEWKSLTAARSVERKRPKASKSHVGHGSHSDLVADLLRHSASMESLADMELANVSEASTLQEAVLRRKLVRSERQVVFLKAQVEKLTEKLRVVEQQQEQRSFHAAEPESKPASSHDTTNNSTQNVPMSSVVASTGPGGSRSARNLASVSSGPSSPTRTLSRDRLVEEHASSEPEQRAIPTESKYENETASTGPRRTRDKTHEALQVTASTDPSTKKGHSNARREEDVSVASSVEANPKGTSNASSTKSNGNVAAPKSKASTQKRAEPQPARSKPSSQSTGFTDSSQNEKRADGKERRPLASDDNVEDRNLAKSVSDADTVANVSEKRGSGSDMHPSARDTGGHEPKPRRKAGMAGLFRKSRAPKAADSAKASKDEAIEPDHPKPESHAPLTSDQNTASVQGDITVPDRTDSDQRSSSRSRSLRRSLKERQASVSPSLRRALDTLVEQERSTVFRAQVMAIALSPVFALLEEQLSESTVYKPFSKLLAGIAAYAASLHKLVEALARKKLVTLDHISIVYTQQRDVLAAQARIFQFECIVQEILDAFSTAQPEQFANMWDEACQQLDEVAASLRRPGSRRAALSVRVDEWTHCVTDGHQARLKCAQSIKRVAAPGPEMDTAASLVAVLERSDPSKQNISQVVENSKRFLRLAKKTLSNVKPPLLNSTRVFVAKFYIKTMKAKGAVDSLDTNSLSEEDQDGDSMSLASDDHAYDSDESDAGSAGKDGQRLSKKKKGWSRLYVFSDVAVLATKRLGRMHCKRVIQLRNLEILAPPVGQAIVGLKDKDWTAVFRTTGAGAAMEIVEIIRREQAFSSALAFAKDDSADSNSHEAIKAVCEAFALT